MSRPNEWTQEEIRIMRRHYQTAGWQKVNELTGRSKAAIHCKAGQMGISGRRGQTKSPWNRRFTIDQVITIRENRRGWTQAKWANELDVSQSMISKIQNRETYSTVFSVTKNNTTAAA